MACIPPLRITAYNTSQAHTDVKIKLTVAEHLKLIFKILAILPARVTVNILRSCLFAWKNGYSLNFYARCGVIKAIFSTLNAREVRSRTPTTTEAYRSFCRAKLRTLSANGSDAALRSKLIPTVEPLPETGGSMLWFGNPAKASKVVLYLHGGGFIIPASSGHLELVWQNFVRTGHEVGVDVAVCLLQYTLLVEGQFPLPLRQTAAALDAILQSGVAPADVFIGGDSAGGNLTMQLIGHLLHPFDGVTRINLQEQQLGGIILISPGLSIDSNYASFRDNANHDMVPSDILAIVSRYRPEGTAENYARTTAAFATGDYTDAEPYQMPISAPEAWLDGIDKVVKRVYLTAGERELIRDHAVALERLLRKKGLGDDVFTFEKADGEGHVFIVLEGMTGQVGDATRRMKEWVTGAVRG